MTVQRVSQQVKGLWLHSRETIRGVTQSARKDASVLLKVLAAIALVSAWCVAETTIGAEPLGFKLGDSNGFVVIASIDPGGLGTKMQSQSGKKLAVGDRIVAVNYNPVFNSKTAAELINSLESPLLLLHIRRRNGESQLPEAAWVWRYPQSKPPTPMADRKIFAIVGGDTDDSESGACIEASVQHVTRCLYANVPEQQVAVHQLTGESFTVDGLVSALSIAAEVATPNDTLLVYLTCHGSTDVAAVSAVHGTSFTNQQVLWFTNQKPLLRDQLLAALGRFDARLRVLVTDSCRKHSDTLTRMLMADGLQVLREQRVSETQLRLANPLQDLLLVPNGIVDWYSCDVGEISSALDEEGGLFTIAACAALESARSGQWAEAQEATADLCAEVSRLSDKRVDQTPIMYRLLDIPISVPEAKSRTMSLPVTVVRP